MFLHVSEKVSFMALT